MILANSCLFMCFLIFYLLDVCRENHIHMVYTKILLVGAAEFIVTDNARTQTGKTATSRGVMTKQRKFVPHNQNQNKAERRIQDVKHKTVNIMELSLMV